VRKVEAILKEHNAWGATFSEISQHSPIAGIRNGMKQYMDAACDCIVAVGGGSPIDASKAILYNIQKDFGGNTPPQIAIPTTLSAAEYTVSLAISSLDIYATYCTAVKERGWFHERRGQ
jgi:alcohol dehydrogenase class IV